MTWMLEVALKLVNVAMLSQVSSTLKSGRGHGRHCQVTISELSGADKAEKGRSAESTLNVLFLVPKIRNELLV